MTTVRSLARSFAGGEVTPEFFGRVDDVKNITGLQRCRNFYVLPHGPVSNRPGTQFVKEVKDSSKSTRLIDFEFDDEQTFVIEIGDQYMRFHTEGATLLAGSPTAWSNATAYVVGDLASRLGVNYYCIAAHTNQQPPNATYWYPMPSDGTFEIPTPYLEADIFDLHYVQSEDVLTITHPGYAVRELRRLGATYWVLSTVSFASELSAPASIAATATVATGTGLITMSYTVTAVDSTGREESLAGTPDDCSNNLLTTGNYNTITWNAVSGASRYNVYKQSNGLYGYIGQTDALTFKDDNITADVSRTPPIAQTPFGSSDNYPAAVSYFEQRRDFGGTNNLPQNIWMTRNGTESNLSYSIPTRDSDAISFKLAARRRNAVRHLVPLIDLVALTSSGVWKITSVNSDSITPTSISAKQQSRVGASNTQPMEMGDHILYEAARNAHIYSLSLDVSGTRYVPVDRSLRAPHLFNNRRIIDMAASEAPYPIGFFTSSNGYLLGLTYVPEEEIFPWFWYDTYTNGGDFDEDTGVTGGDRSLFKSVAVVPEGNEDAIYVIAERLIDGATVQYIERFASRNFVTLENAYFVDCGISYDGNPKNIESITQANPGVVTITGHGYNNGDDLDFTEIEGMEELNGQRVYVKNKTANTFELADQHGTNINTTSYTAYTGGGVSRTVISSISAGIDHLEGETVSILGNGAVQPKKTVTGGAITLDQPASIIQIGLPIEADIQLLPLAYEAREGGFGQGRVKNVNEVWLRVHESSGIFAGPSFTRLTEIKQRTNEPYGTPPALKSAELPLKITPSWGDSGAPCVRQSDPLPLTIVSMTLEVEVGS
ncbi:MAG: hypothetical protein IT558_00755 [Alphaproteobacteria bacterium]|nr:hypothetical protein [Alphaproteobacteria bacterium]